jgi:hypothetical protein
METNKQKYYEVIERWRVNAPAGVLPLPNPYEVSGYPRMRADAYQRANAYWSNEVDFNRQSVNADTTNTSYSTIDPKKGGKPRRRDQRNEDVRPDAEKGKHSWSKVVTHKSTSNRKKIWDMTLPDKPIDYGCKPCKICFQKGFPCIQHFGNSYKEYMEKKIDKDRNPKPKGGDKKEKEGNDGEYQIPDA